MIDSASKLFVHLDQWADRAPVISTITNLSILILKCVRPIIEYLSNKLSCVKSFSENRLVKHIFNKPASRCFTLLLPFAGNFVVYRFDAKVPKQYYEEACRMIPSPERVAMFEKAAHLGNVSAMESAGMAYSVGYGVKKDTKKAFDYFIKAAELGSAYGLRNLGYAYYKGEGTEINLTLAKTYLTQAAEKNDDCSCHILGNLFRESGDFKTAFAWYQRGAKLGNAYSMNQLGMSFSDGKGVQKNDYQALKHFKQSAAKVCVDGLHNAGWAYLRGRGTDKNLKLAEQYLIESANRGSASSKYLLGQLFEEKYRFSKAREWYQKATDAGHTAASEKLAELKRSWKNYCPI